MCRAVAAAVFGDADKGQVRAAQRPGAFDRAAVGRDRHAVAEHHLDAFARHRQRPQLHGDHLLRRPGLHGEEGPRREKRAGTGRRHRLRADRHHHRSQPGRLLPRQQHEIDAGDHREVRRSHRRVPGRALRRHHLRRLAARRHPRQRHPEPGRSRDPAGDHLQGAVGAGRAPWRRPVVRHRQVGRSTPPWRPRRRASPPRTWTRRRAARIPP